MSSMTTRDRLMLVGIVAIVILGAMWMLVVSPARNEASKAQAEVVKMHEQVAQAQSEVDGAKRAQQEYRSAYASLASLGTAVPASPEVPSLIYALDHAANSQNVEFSSIASAASGSSGPAHPATPAATPAAAGATGAAAAPVAPFTQMPFTFVFNGDYTALIHLLTQLESFTVQTSKGALKVSGRLLTIQSIALAQPQSSGAAGAQAKGGSEQMSWTITASAYVLAPTAATGGTATPGAPAGPGASSTTTSAPAGAASPATPAVVKVGG